MDTPFAARLAFGRWLVTLTLPVLGIYLILNSSQRATPPSALPTPTPEPEAAYRLVWLSQCGQAKGALGALTREAAGCQSALPVPLTWLQAQLLQQEVLQPAEYWEPLAHSLDARCEVAIQQGTQHTVGLLCMEANRLYRAANNGFPSSSALPMQLDGSWQWPYVQLAATNQDLGSR